MTDALAAIAEPHRRRLLQLLTSGPCSVTALAEHFPVTRSAISQHLAVLSEAGLVSNNKVGRQRLYRIVPSGMALLRAELDLFWTGELDLLASAATLLANEITTAPTASLTNDIPRQLKTPKETDARRKVRTTTR